jgi:hypothetical protein
MYPARGSVMSVISILNLDYMSTFSKIEMFANDCDQHYLLQYMVSSGVNYYIVLFSLVRTVKLSL